jgi:hypothetical protein
MGEIIQTRRCVNTGLKMFLVNPLLQFSFELGDAGAKLEDLVNVDLWNFRTIRVRSCPQFKVFNTVVGLDSILVVHDLPWFQEPSKKFFHDNPMFWNSPIIISLNGRVIWCIGVGIPITVDVNVALKIVWTHLEVAGSGTVPTNQ